MKKSLYFAVFVTIIFSGCSLDYGTRSDDESAAPEFIFSNVRMLSIEEGKVDSEIQASKMEQYRTIDAVFAQDVNFRVYNDEGKIDIEGQCGLLSADNDNDLYILSNNVSVTSYEQDLRIESTTLRWNNKTEQLTNGKDEPVTIINGLKNRKAEYAHPEKETENSLTMTGFGLAASGVTRTYSISQGISGSIETGSDE